MVRRQPVCFRAAAAATAAAARFTSFNRLLIPMIEMKMDKSLSVCGCACFDMNQNFKGKHSKSN